MTGFSNHEIMIRLTTLIREAGEAVMAVYATDFAVSSKDDRSPVTKADTDAEAVITRGLKEITPDIPLIAEEAASAGNIPDIGDRRFWLVDPLDGTKEFLNRNGEFTVNIALIEDGRPVIGLVLAPALDTLYTGIVGEGAWKKSGQDDAEVIRVRDVPDQGLTIVASRRHGDPETLNSFLAGRTVNEHISAGSSLKFCLLAEGKADIYPRFGRTMEWDTAAGQAVLEAAGGLVTDTGGKPLAYGKGPIYENPFFIGWGSLRP